MKQIHSAGRPDLFDRDFLKGCGFNESNSILYTNLFIALGLIDAKGEPTSDYERFINSEEESRAVIAERVWEKYTDIFAEDRQVQDKPIEKISETFRKVYGDEHSDSFINLLASTFKALVDYAGLQINKKMLEPELVSTETYTNGTSEHVLNEEKSDAQTDQAIEDSDTDYPVFSESALDSEENLISDAVSEDVIDEVETFSDDESSEQGTDPDILSELINDSPKSETKRKEDAVATEIINKDKDNQADTDPFAIKSVNHEKSEDEFLVKALFKRANLLQKLERTEEEVNALDQIVEYLDNSDQTGQEEILSKTLIRKAEILEKMGDDEKALAAYEQYITRFYKSR